MHAMLILLTNNHPHPYRVVLYVICGIIVLTLQCTALLCATGVLYMSHPLLVVPTMVFGVPPKVSVWAGTNGHLLPLQYLCNGTYVT